MTASYNFKLESEERYHDSEVCVQADTYQEAKELAEKLIEGSNLRLGEVKRVIDARLTVVQSNITEHLVKHSGELTEVRVNGGKRKQS